MKFIYYQGADGQWYWRLVARNNKNVADGAEGYKTKANVITAIKKIRWSIDTTSIKEGKAHGWKEQEAKV